MLGDRVSRAGFRLSNACSVCSGSSRHPASPLVRPYQHGKRLRQTQVTTGTEAESVGLKGHNVPARGPCLPLWLQRGAPQQPSGSLFHTHALSSSSAATATTGPLATTAPSRTRTTLHPRFSSRYFTSGPTASLHCRATPSALRSS